MSRSIDFRQEKGLRCLKLPQQGGERMNRNVSIVIAVLVLVVIAGYLVWLRSKVDPSVSPGLEQQVQVTPSPEPTLIATPSAVPADREATSSVRSKNATSGATRR